MKVIIIAVFALITSLFAGVSFSQKIEKPKLVVGIVVDQMRFDYLYRFNPYFGKNGINRLMNEGSNFTFAHFNYSPTNTAPGHASIFTGTTPFFHGIIGNDWYDKVRSKMIYCVNDTSVRSVGSHDQEGEMSPKNLLATTITDQLKLSNNNASKVISISMKNRGAILPGGHCADAAYWYDLKTGDIITSSYYMTALPLWVEDFNNRKLVLKYLSKGWKLSLPESDYLISFPDESKYEKDVFREGKTTFPHHFNRLNENEKYDAFETTPFGNNIVQEFAKAALVNEKLGQGDETDFITISFSSTDHVGHDYGTFSYETQDTYIKLDSLISDLLLTLDKHVGKGNYLLFLTADHGGLETPGMLKERRLPTRELNNKKFLDSLKSFALRNFGDEKLIENHSNRQIYFNRFVIKKKNLNIHEVEQRFADYLRDTFPVIASINKSDDLQKQIPSRESSNPILNGFNPAVSGDITYSLQPGYLPNFVDKGTTHSTAYSYDTHVPLLFYGWHIPKLTINTPVYTIDIAPTIANLLKIAEPSASIGIPLIK